MKVCGDDFDLKFTKEYGQGLHRFDDYKSGRSVFG
jgi:hypothetical protein